MDSIFVLGHSNFRLSLVNSEGALIRSYKLSNAHSPRAYTLLPMVKEHKKLYINNYNSVDKLDPIMPRQSDSLVIELDLVTGETAFHLSFPPTYANKIWTSDFVKLYHAYNPLNQTFIYNFPASDKLIITNFQDINYSVDGRLDGIEAPEPYGNNTTGISALSMEERVSDFSTKDSYYAVYFDRFRNQYFRVGVNGMDERTYDKGGRVHEITWAAFDLNFRKKFEFQPVKNSYTASMVFFTREGLNMAKFDPGDEDRLTFGIFEIQ